MRKQSLFKDLTDYFFLIKKTIFFLRGISPEHIRKAENYDTMEKDLLIYITIFIRTVQKNRIDLSYYSMNLSINFNIKNNLDV